MNQIIRTIMKSIGYILLLVLLYILISIGISYIGKQENERAWFSEGSLFETVFEKQLAYRFTPSISPSIRWNALLIHGFAAWWETWVDQEKLLSEKGFHVYSLDLPPFGFSDRYDLDYYSRERQADLINEFIRKKRLEKVLLVAHSYGWKAAMEAYMKNPSVFSWMVLLDVALWFPKEEKNNASPKEAESIWKQYAFRSISRFAVTNTFLGTKALQSFLFEKSSLSEERLKIYKKPFQVRGKGDMLGDWIYYTSLHPDSWLSNEKSSYSRVFPPTLILWGKEDTITPLVQGETLHTMMSGSELVVIPNVNHIPQIEAPEVVRTTLSTFIAKYFN